MSRSTWGKLILLALLWGSEFAIIKIALEGIGPVELVFVRLALAAMLLFAVALAARERPPGDKTFYLHCAILGLMATVLPYFLMAWAQQRVDSALVGILVGSGPLMTVALAAVLLTHERPGPAKLVGLFVGFGGVVIVMEPWQGASGELWGTVAALGVALGFAAGYVYNVRFLTSRKESGPMIMATQSFFATAYAGMWLLATGDVQARFDFNTTLAIVSLGLLNTGAAAIVFFALLRSSGAVATSVVEYLMVVVAVVLGVVFLHEHISPATAIGVALILGGVALAEGRRSKSSEPLPPPVDQAAVIEERNRSSSNRAIP